MARRLKMLELKLSMSTGERPTGLPITSPSTMELKNYIMKPILPFKLQSIMSTLPGTNQSNFVKINLFFELE